MKFIAAIAFSLSFAGTSQAAVIQFDLLGKGGAGLLPTNQNTAVAGNPGRGGEIAAGIIYDDSSKILTINVGWGSGFGFVNLTGNAVAGHIHGPTASAAPGSFTEDAPILIFLDVPPLVWNPSSSTGSIVGNVNMAANEAALLAGRLYINVHTGLNGGGEIRGNLVQAPVPEPTAGLLGALGGIAAFSRRRRGTTSTLHELSTAQ